MRNLVHSTVNSGSCIYDVLFIMSWSLPDSLFPAKYDIKKKMIVDYYKKSGRLNKIDILVSKILSNNNKIFETLQKMKKVNRLELWKKEDKDRN
jgi:hypothetical protein